MHPFRKCPTRPWRAWPVLLVALLIPPTLRADFAIVPLDELIGGSSAVVLGTVQSVQPMKGAPGSYLMDVSIDETIVGTSFERLLLPASTFDPLLPAVQEVGTRLFVFVPPGEREITEAEVVALSPNHPPEPGRELIALGARGAKGLLLPAVQKFLLKGSGIPPELLGSLLETLRETGAGGGPHVKELLTIACTAAPMYRMEAQLFAIGELGDGKVADARSCLEETALATENLSRRIAAVEALGTLGDPASVKPLLTLLPRLPAGVIATLRGDEDDPIGGYGPNDDPEAEGGSDPDPGETRVAGEADPGDGGGGDADDGDGERELDMAPSDDEMLGRDVGGLADAVVLALGKIGSPKAVAELFRVAREGDDLALHSSVVVALGMIGGRTVHGPLTSIAKTHPNDLVRDLAMQTLARLEGGRR